MSNSESASAVNFKNVQGDIIFGLQKRVEAFLFCTLNSDSRSIENFRKSLKTQILPLITTTQDVIDSRKKVADHKKEKKDHQHKFLPITQINIGFSFNGLKKLGVESDEIPSDGNSIFTTGQKADALANLSDPVDPKTQKLSTWSPDFSSESNPIDLVFLITAPDNSLLHEKIHLIKEKLLGFLSHTFVRTGNVRPGDQAGHEHFGYLDGISQPAIANVNATPEDQKAGIVQPDVILLGQQTDSVTNNNNNLDPKHSWIKDSSFMAFRELKQLVPEFFTFCDQSAKRIDNKEVSGEFIGARIVGRWKSGAPIVLAPIEDDPKLIRAQDFDYSDDLKQELCPYASHIRKTNPRKGIAGADPNAAVLPHLMTRHGIPYGPELSQQEKDTNQTIDNRGLLFVSYQSKLESGFQFVQKLWCNNINFPPKTPAKITPGFDLLIGQAGNGAPRTAHNINKLGVGGASDPNNVLTAINDFVVPLGGEYFLMPSIQAIDERLSL